MRFNSLLATCAGVLAVALPLSANAAPVIFSGIDNNGSESTPLASTPNSDAARNNFFSNLVGVGTETFETQSGGAPLAVSFGAAGTATLTGNGSVASVTPGTTNGNGRYSIPSATSSRYWQVDATAGNFNIAFTNPIAAFGFYGVDIGDFSGTVSIQLTDIANNVFNLPVPAAPQNLAFGSVLYFGFYDLSNTYTNISFLTTGGTGDVFGFDNFSIGTAEQVVVSAPEPLTLSLFGAGLVAAGAVRRRMRKQKA